MRQVVCRINSQSALVSFSIYPSHPQSYPSRSITHSNRQTHQLTNQLPQASNKKPSRSSSPILGPNNRVRNLSQQTTKQYADAESRAEEMQAVVYEKRKSQNNFLIRIMPGCHSLCVWIACSSWNSGLGLAEGIELN